MVLKVYERIESHSDSSIDPEHQATLTLPFELRQKSRLKATLDDGTEVGLILSRGGLLRGGDLLRAENGLMIKVVAGEELVSKVTHDDHLMRARACYHLGNRHVPLHISENYLSYTHDHVLDEMVMGLGLNVECVKAPFEPEGGAYGGGHQHHQHDDHEHTHSHSH